MSEEPQKKTIEKEPVKPENGEILDKELDSLDKNTGFSKKSNAFLEKTLKYHVKEKVIEKQLQYLIETPEQIKIRIEREITATNKTIWLDLFSKTMGSYAEINKRTGTAKSTFYYWFNNDEEFRETIRTVKQNNQNDMEDILILQAKSGNMTALIKWLEANHPKYGKKLKVETYTGNKTYEDILDEIEEELNNEEINEKQIGNSDGERQEEIVEPTPDREPTENKKQEGKDSSVSS